MRIALVDNMNNNFFALGRYLRDLGHDADLFLIPKNSTPQFHPQADTWSNVDKLSWIKSFPISYGSLNYLKPSPALKNCFAGYDHVIACGDAVGLLALNGIRLDLFVPYGSDLFHTPFIDSYENRSGFFRKFVGRAFDRRRANWQMKGIQDSLNIICNTNWERAKKALDSLGVTATNLPRVMVYEESASPQSMTFDETLRGDFIVFSPVRHLWKTNVSKLADFDRHGGTKRNDKLIRAFARLVEMSVHKNPQLWLCEYGADVEASKLLIKSLDIEEHVRWLPLMDRREIREYAKKATFIADQFRETMSATSAGVTNEALALGVPVIANADGALEDPKDPYFRAPILQALTEDEILSHLLLHSRDINAHKNIAAEGRIFFETHLGIGLTERYLKLLEHREKN